MAKMNKDGQPLTKKTDKKIRAKGKTKVDASAELPPQIVGVDLLARTAVQTDTLLYDPHLRIRQKDRKSITDMDIEFALKRCRRDRVNDRYQVDKQCWQYSLIGKSIDGYDICVGVEVHENVLVVTAYRV